MNVYVWQGAKVPGEWDVWSVSVCGLREVVMTGSGPAIAYRCSGAKTHAVPLWRGLSHLLSREDPVLSPGDYSLRSGAKSETSVPSGSVTSAYRWPQNASHGALYP